MRFDPALPDEGINVSQSHPVKEVITLVSGIIVVGLTVSLIIATAVEWVVPLIPVSWEMKMAGWWSGDDDKERLPADGREQLLADVAQRLSHHWPEMPYTIKTDILESDEPNALALPGGLILVTQGLLDRVASENELAFVVGHEIGHFRNRDHLRGLGRAVGFGVVNLIMVGAGAGQLGDFSSLVGSVTDRGFSRDQEREADDFGIGLVHAEYGHVTGSWHFFEHLRDAENAVEQRLAAYLSTHPLSEERIEHLRLLADARGWTIDGELIPMPVKVREPEKTSEPSEDPDALAIQEDEEIQ